MSKARSITLIYLCANILSGCGGGNTSNLSTPIKSTPAPIETNAFLTIAKDTSCADLQNRLFVIDQQYVLSEKLGTCSDARYRQTLFGKTPENVVCSNADSIAGPRYNCSDPSAAAIFKQAIEHLDYPDLGLGPNHQIQQIIVPADAETNLRITALGASLFYGKAPINAVIKDDKLWTQFVELGKFTVPQKLNLDFASDMVIGSFFASPNNCSQHQILKVSTNGQKITAQFHERSIVSLTSCDKTSPQASTPMSLVRAPRLALPVDFVEISGQKIGFDVIEKTSNSMIQTPRALVVKDQAAWSTLWQEHNAVINRPLPTIDFSKKMLIAVFTGSKPNGCYGDPEITVWRYNKRINVSYLDGQPPLAPETLCTMAIVSPAQIMMIDRSDESVDFTTIPIIY
ncbi:hypothetical protein H8K35_01920 [Undibacterium sp. LX40W]|uniref:Uncharacterized protein n=1 Tax=Undibacterium nitidum TaxID=2762298 RepID=A0A923KKJ4_9BURK|nr:MULTISPECIES: hypothetical protein [Undibacterium]MBC3880860.1 hypothetical protein [Undibacterium nitidum]MBC3890407.1 hypothetical protein [Undibacterium sp. LX40W]